MSHTVYCPECEAACSDSDPKCPICAHALASMPAVATKKRRRVWPIVVASCGILAIGGCVWAWSYMARSAEFTAANGDLFALANPDHRAARALVWSNARADRAKLDYAFKVYERWTGKPHPRAAMDLDIPVITNHLRDVCAHDLNALAENLAFAVQMRRECLAESSVLSTIVELTAHSTTEVVCAAACVDAVYDAPVPEAWCFPDDD